jgi:hypothetical protein
VHVLGTLEHLEGVQSGFEKFGVGSVSWGGLTTPRRSDPRGWSNRPPSGQIPKGGLTT